MNLGKHFDKYEAPDMVTHAYEATRHAICERSFVPGQRLDEQQLADRFGISRTPVRQALVRLAADGYVESVPRRGMFVRKMSLHDMHDLAIYRRVIEAGAAPSAAMVATEAQLKEIHELGAELDAACISADWEQVYVLELRFHLRVMDLARSKELRRAASNAEMILWILGYLDRAVPVLPPRQGNRIEPPHSHVWLAEAIAGRDPVVAFHSFWQHASDEIEKLDLMIAEEQASESPALAEPLVSLAS